MKNAKRVAIYTKFAEGINPNRDNEYQSQVRVISELAIACGYYLVGEYVDYYPYKIKSGRTRLFDLISDAKEQEFEVVIVIETNMFNSFEMECKQSNLNQGSLIADIVRFNDLLEGIPEFKWRYHSFLDKGVCMV